MLLRKVWRTPEDPGENTVNPHPLVCHKRRLYDAVLWMRPEKPRSRVAAGVAL